MWALPPFHFCQLPFQQPTACLQVTDAATASPFLRWLPESSKHNIVNLSSKTLSVFLFKHKFRFLLHWTSGKSQSDVISMFWAVKTYAKVNIEGLYLYLTCVNSFFTPSLTILTVSYLLRKLFESICLYFSFCFELPVLSCFCLA